MSDQERQQCGDELPSFARGMSSPLGKFTCEVKTHLDEATFTTWLRLCAAREVTSSELLRDLIYLVAHGRTPAELAAQDRRELLGGRGTTEARERLGVPL